MTKFKVGDVIWKPHRSKHKYIVVQVLDDKGNVATSLENGTEIMVHNAYGFTVFKSRLVRNLPEWW